MSPTAKRSGAFAEAALKQDWINMVNEPTQARSALVTGASRGIGYGIAHSLAQQGFGLTITSRSAGDLERISAELHEAGAPVVVHHATDMAAHNDLPTLIELHAQAFGGCMSALVVNAGFGTAAKVTDIDIEDVPTILDVNLVAAFVLVQAALPLLRAGAQADPVRGSNIVGLSSITGVHAARGLAAYGASKAGLSLLLEAINREEAANRITATSVSPGYVETDMSAWVTSRIPAESMIQVSDVVSIVDMLLSLSANAAVPAIKVTRSSSNGIEP